MAQLRRFPVAVGVISVAASTVGDGYAFHRSGDTLYAFSYSSASYLAQRGTLDATSWPLWLTSYGSTSTGTTSANVILTDSDGNVGDGSLVFVGDDDVLVTWDVEGGTTHTRTAASGYHVGSCLYDNGYLYWAEVEDAPHGGGRYFYVRLMRGRTDFTSVSTLATHTFDGTASDGIACDAYNIRRTSTGCWFYVHGYFGETNPNGDVWLADGGSTTITTADANATDGMRASTNAAIYGTKPYSLAASPGTPTDLYPMATGIGWASGNVIGSTYQSYVTGVSYRWAVAGDGSATTADATVSLDDADAIGTAPDLYYLATE